MEINPFGKGPESSGDDADDSSSKKKKAVKRVPLFKPESETSNKSEKSEAAEKKDSAEPIWRRILNQPEDDKEASAENDLELEQESAEADLEINEQQAPLESLSEAEQFEIAEAYIAARHAEILDEQATAVEGGDETTVQERAADIALLEAMRSLMARDAGEHSVSEPIEEAYDSTVQSLGFAEIANQTRASEETPLEPETLPLPPSEAILLHPEQTESVSEYSTAPSPANAEKPVELKTSEATIQRRVGSALTVGGIIGYYIGRRRGRIKTEKQHKTVEAKLTKQIENVQQLLFNKEQQIRNLARENYQAKAPSQVRPLSERVISNNEKRTFVPSEHLGVVTVKAAEALRKPEASNQAIEMPKIEKAEQQKSVDSLSRPELLAVASEINVGATNLRRVFETNLISEHGLRRLVAAHQRGGNVREALEREIIEKEMSYERDPQVRNRSVGSVAAGRVVREDMDKPAPATSTQSGSQQTPQSDKSTTAAQKKTKSQTAQPAAVAATVTLVVVIAVLLLILFKSS